MIRPIRIVVRDLGDGSTRNRVVPVGAPDEAAFEIVATPTPLQARALALLKLTPASV